MAVDVDVTQRDSVNALAERTELELGGASVLVNNAGVVTFTPVAQQEEDGWRWIVDVNLFGVIYGIQAFLPRMLESGRDGHIVNVASLAGPVPAPAGHTLYAAAKAFLIKFSEALANEVRRHNVHVTALCPGFTRSEFHDVTGTRSQMNQMPRWMWLEAATVARQGYDAVMSGKHIYINGRVNRTIAALVRLLPQRVVYAIGRSAGRTYRKA